MELIFAKTDKTVKAVPVFGKHDKNTIEQLLEVAPNAERLALMADGHFGYIMPVGGVAAYPNKVSASGVGYDIACGNAAIRTDLLYSDIHNRRNEIADEIWNTIAFGRGKSNEAKDAPKDHPLFEDAAWATIPNNGEQRQQLLAKARNQLGSTGSGNHYVDVFEDENGFVWVGVHFGSRGFGHTIASGFRALFQGQPWGKHVPEVETILDLHTELGDAYWQAMLLAGRYAYAGREWVARKVVSILGAKELELIHNHHNFAWREKHFDVETGEHTTLVVVRKGATPAFPGQKGFIGGSMGDNAVIVEGSSDPKVKLLQRHAMFSTVHGAGRVMSRNEARGKINRRTGVIKKPGKVSQEMMETWLKDNDVILRGGGLDESPHAYRRLPDVLEAQGDTINILHTLRPVIVAMAQD